jgi:hypothetical protein
VVIRLAARAVAALLVTASGARAADDNHASTLAAILGVRHVFGVVLWGGRSCLVEKRRDVVCLVKAL